MIPSVNGVFEMDKIKFALFWGNGGFGRFEQKHSFNL